MTNIKSTAPENQSVVKQPDSGKIEKNAIPTKRVRVPLHAQSKFDLEQYGLDVYNFFYYFADDNGNKITKMERAGYEKVIHDGKPVTRSRGDHQEGSQYLMRIPKHEHEADMIEKQRYVDEIESDMGKKPNDDFYVKKVDISRG